MRSLYVLSTALMAVTVGSIAPAKAFEWAQSGDQVSAAAQLASGYVQGDACNKTIRTEVAAEFIRTRVAKSPAVTPLQAADLMRTVLGIQAMNKLVLGQPSTKKEQATYCAAAIRGFGPNGTAIRGLLVDD